MRTMLLLAGLTFAASASAQSVVLTEKSGRPLVVNGNQELPASTPTSLAPAQVVDAFATLCTPDPLTAANSRSDALALNPADQTFADNGKHTAVAVRHWAGSGAELTIFEGSKDALKGEPIAIVERAYATTGQYGPFNAPMPQCNLLITMSDFAAAKAVAVEMEAKFGAAKKMVVKERWADARWVSIGADAKLSLSMTAPQTRGGPQPVHLSAYIKE